MATEPLAAELAFTLTLVGEATRRRSQVENHMFRCARRVHIGASSRKHTTPPQHMRASQRVPRALARMCAHIHIHTQHTDVCDAFSLCASDDDINEQCSCPCVTSNWKIVRRRIQTLPRLVCAIQFEATSSSLSSLFRWHVGVSEWRTAVGAIARDARKEN